jgi:uncharacterized cupin superfamily protein
LVRVDAGELVIVLDGKEHRVPAGTTASYDAARPHGYRNHGPEVARFTMVVAVPPPH